MAEEPVEEEVVEEETPVEEEVVAEEPVAEEPVAEEPEAGEEGDHSNSEPISLPTPDADDVPENKLHLIDRTVKPTREVAPEPEPEEGVHEEEPVVEEVAVEEAPEGAAGEEAVDGEEADGSGVGSDKQHLLGRQVKSPRATAAKPALAEELPAADRVMEGADPAGIDVGPVDEEIGLDAEIVIEESFVAVPEKEIAEPEIGMEPQIVMPIDWFCVLPTPFSIGVLGFPVDENGNPIVRPDVPATDRGVSDEELVTVTGVPAVDPKGILVGRSVKPAPLPVDPSQPSPKGILMQRKPKTAPATVE